MKSGRGIRGEREKVIQLLVDKKWTTENIYFLGSGFLYHLAYPVEVIEPQLLVDLQSKLIPPGIEMEVIFRTEQEWKRIALAELENFFDFQTFIRLEFRLLHSPPSLKTIKYFPDNGYLLQYKKRNRL